MTRYLKVLIRREEFESLLIADVLYWFDRDRFLATRGPGSIEDYMGVYVGLGANILGSPALAIPITDESTQGIWVLQELSSVSLIPRKRITQQQLAYALEQCIKEHGCKCALEREGIWRIKGLIDLDKLAKRIFECMEGPK